MKRIRVSGELIMQVLTTGAEIGEYRVLEGVDPDWRLAAATVEGADRRGFPLTLVLWFDDGKTDISDLAPRMLQI